MIQRLPLHWPGWTSRATTVSPVADHVDELAAERLLHGALGNGERAIPGETR